MKLENKHAGELILVYGNGPSLLRLKGFEKEVNSITSIGINSANIYPEILPIESPYILCHDFLSMKKKLRERIEDTESLIFYPEVAGHDHPLRRRPPENHFRYRISGRVPGRDFIEGLYSGASSILAGINLAFVLGAAEIGILGLDLNDQSHFYSDKGKGIPFPTRTEIICCVYWLSLFLKSKNIRCWICSDLALDVGFQAVSVEYLLWRNNVCKEFQFQGKRLPAGKKPE